MTTNTLCLPACIWQFRVCSCCCKDRWKKSNRQKERKTDRNRSMHWSAQPTNPKKSKLCMRYIIVLTNMLLRYEYQIDAKCNLIFGFFGCIFESERRTWIENERMKARRSRRNANRLSNVRFSDVWSWSLSFYLWMESILKSDLSAATTTTTTNQN